MSHNTPVYDPARLSLKIQEAADYMRCSRRTVERLIARGELVAVHVASRRRLRIEEIDRYLERGERV
jgi:excisionase family DNA binding protein